jgi:hypothetical protein
MIYSYTQISQYFLPDRKLAPVLGRSSVVVATSTSTSPIVLCLLELLFFASWPLPFEIRLWEDLRADPCLA